MASTLRRLHRSQMGRRSGSPLHLAWSTQHWQKMGHLFSRETLGNRLGHLGSPQPKMLLDAMLSCIVFVQSVPSDALAFHDGTGDFSSALFSPSFAAHCTASTHGSSALRQLVLARIEGMQMSPIPVQPLWKKTFLA
jgi:hypothetical protein